MGADVNQLAEPLRSAVIGLIAESAGKVTLVSGRRNSSEQIALRKQNCGPTEYDIFSKPSGQCSPVTAIPGTSKHELGLAADLGGQLDLAAKLAPKYQLVRTVPSENWHYEHASTAGSGDKAPDIGPPIKEGRASIGDLPSVAGGLANAVGGHVPGYGVLKDTAGAAVAVASAILNPTTWLRAVGIVAGLGLVAVGLNLISKDAGGPSISPGGIATKATAAAVGSPAALAAI